MRQEPAGQAGRDAVRLVLSTVLAGPASRRSRTISREHGVQALALDVLHGVVVHPLVLAHAEDRDDVGVVQQGGGPGLALEPDQLDRSRGADAATAPSGPRAGPGSPARPRRRSPCRRGRSRGGSGSRPAARASARRLAAGRATGPDGCRPRCRTAPSSPASGNSSRISSASSG